jgi:ABC-2 type transport system permease protein
MIRATVFKDTQLLLRDRGALASMFALPLIFIAAFGFMFQNSGSNESGSAPPKTPLAVYAPNEDAAHQILKDLEEAKAFNVRRAGSEAEVDRLVAERACAGGLLIPPDFDPMKKRPATIVIDLALPDSDRMAVEGPLQAAVIAPWFQRRFGLGSSSSGVFIPGQSEFFASRSPAGLRRKRQYVDSFQITVPGNAVLFCFFICVAVGLSFVEERRLGTWRRLLAAPVPRVLVLVAKLVPFFLIGILQMAFLFATGAFVFGMHLAGSIPALALVTGALVFSAVGLGFLVASFGGSEKLVGSVASIAVLVMGLVSGCMFPRAFMPEAFQKAGLFVPHGWALDAYRDVIVRDGTTMGDVLFPSIVLVGFGLLFAGAGALIFRAEK